jgi:hypothetical protein
VCLQVLVDYLATESKREQVAGQVRRLEKLISSAKHEVEAVMQTISVVEARQLDTVMRSIEDNTSSLYNTSVSAHLTANSMRLVQAMVLISLVFNVIDRIGAGSLNVPAPSWVVALIKEPLMDPPFVWFLVNVVIAAVVYVIFHYLQGRRLERARRTLAAQIHCRCTLDSVAALEAYLHRREPFLLYKTNSDSASALCTVRYREPTTTDIWKWGGAPPEVQITFDQKRGELLGVCLWVDRALNSSPESALVRTLLKCLVNCGALNSLQLQGVMLTYDRPGGASGDLSRYDENVDSLWLWLCLRDRGTLQQSPAMPPCVCARSCFAASHPTHVSALHLCLFLIRARLAPGVLQADICSVERVWEGGGRCRGAAAGCRGQGPRGK